ncbi:MAG: hypothetical protein JWR54_1075 [Mucilaginibacter sp.]|nr:hypothetical protein [Mucilaginibacter sp.]
MGYYLLASPTSSPQERTLTTKMIYFFFFKPFPFGEGLG